MTIFSDLRSGKAFNSNMSNNTIIIINIILTKSTKNSEPLEFTQSLHTVHGLLFTVCHHILSILIRLHVHLIIN